MWHLRLQKYSFQSVYPQTGALEKVTMDNERHKDDVFSTLMLQQKALKDKINCSKPESIISKGAQHFLLLQM